MECRGFTEVCTGDEARQYFRDCNLTYKDITEGDILSLVLLLNKEIKRSNKIGETSVKTMRLSQKIDAKYDSKGRLISCFIYLNSHYFTRRECISFDKDGFIGFAGWADIGNLNPIKRAFLAWCKILREDKNDGENIDRGIAKGVGGAS